MRLIIFLVYHLSGFIWAIGGKLCQDINPNFLLNQFIMIKILVPTDFSPNANLALEHALKVANQLSGEVHVLHAYQIETRTGSFVTIENIIQEDREKDIAKLVEQMQPLLKSGTQLEGHVRKGSSVDSIIKKAQKIDADMIIMGTTGAGGMKKLFLGSTASNVINETSIPVLAIPMDIHNFDLAKITLALDTKNIENLSVLDPLVKLAKAFKSSLMLVTILDPIQVNPGVDPEIEAFFKEADISYTYFGITAPDVIVCIQEFVVREKSDLLCVLHRSRGLFEGFFDQSVAKQIAFDSSVPLLVLRA
jgi:nucleotide-binding universal stress UspA family protein